MEPINFFESPEFLEPKCPKCGAKLDYGINTAWDERAGAHSCLRCGTLLE